MSDGTEFVGIVMVPRRVRVKARTANKAVEAALNAFRPVAVYEGEHEYPPKVLELRERKSGDDEPLRVA